MYWIYINDDKSAEINELKSTESPVIEKGTEGVRLDLEESQEQEIQIPFGQAQIDPTDANGPSVDSGLESQEPFDETISISPVSSGEKEGYNLLHNAALTCNPEEIRKIVTAHPDLINKTTQDEHLKTAMVLIIENGRDVDNIIECIDELKGASVNVLCGGLKGRHCALYCAIKRNEPKLIDYLLKRGANAGAFSYSKPILHHAIEHCTEETFPQVFMMLRDRKVDLTQTSIMNRAAIHEAAALNKAHAIKTMKPYCYIERLTPVSDQYRIYTDEELLQRKKICGGTALHVAARFNSEAAYRQLIEFGASDTIRDFYDKMPEFYNPTMVKSFDD